MSHNLFFYLHGDHPDLHVLPHSFPTRRSSDRKAKKEIRVASLFKAAAPEFLEMIVVHELAHLKEADHNKAFYQLCQYMLADYHQREFDLRSEEHTSELPSLMRLPCAVFCLKQQHAHNRLSRSGRHDRRH